MESSNCIHLLQPWEKFFYQGDRLNSEVALHATCFSRHLQRGELVKSLSLVLRSYGVEPSVSPQSQFATYLSSQDKSLNSSDTWRQILPVFDLPDALMYWALVCRLPSININSGNERVDFLRRLANLLYLNLPERLDLISMVLTCTEASELYFNPPPLTLLPGQCYSRPEAYLPQLQLNWVNCSYEKMWLSCLLGQLYGRPLPLSDHHIRALSVLGEADRALSLFLNLYNSCPSRFPLSSLSNLFFLALGSSSLDQSLVDQLIVHFDDLANKEFIGLFSSEPTPPSRQLVVNEKPTLVVISSDLYQHPVGRFWLPIARHLQSHFHVISVAGHSHLQDPIRSELFSLSDEWLDLKPNTFRETATYIRALSPSFLLDLGGHTADNYPFLLSQRLATVQATYLGFYGPTYAKHCDWWIVDDALMKWISDSYPGSESLWPLPSPSLCYVPEIHGLPEANDIAYRESSFSIYGSFNHTRKLTPSIRKRFADVLNANPDSLLKFRSHSFRDTPVRRLFLSRFCDLGVAPHQLQALPYAPSYADALRDFASINLHLDTSPVSGTTTTIDSLVMGIPVLTSPTPYYAGAISSAILKHAGLSSHICEDSEYLPAHAKWLSELYSSAYSRRELSRLVRNSPLCDSTFIPKIFIEQLKLMLRQKQAD